MKATGGGSCFFFGGWSRSEAVLLSADLLLRVEAAGLVSSRESLASLVAGEDTAMVSRLLEATLLCLMASSVRLLS